jgi:MFS family permease
MVTWATVVDAQQEDAAANALARRNGRLYLIGLAASLIGNNAMSLVAGIWVKSLTGSSSEAGLVSVCVYAPSLVGPIGGLVADRVRRRRWLLTLNLVSAAMMLPLLAVGGRDAVWIIFAVMTWYGIDLVFSGAAESGLFAEMLPAELRQRLNGWNLGLQETGRLVAPLFGAGLFALVGGGSVAVFDAATFVVAAAMISRIRLHEAKPTPQRNHWRADLVAGLGHIRHTTDLRRLVVAAAVVIGVSGVGVAAQYSLVQALGEPPSFLGVLSAGLGAGSIVASLASGRLLRRISEPWLAVIGMVDYALGSVMRSSGFLPLAVAGSLVLGFALPWVFLAVLNLAQRCTPLPLQGRVSAAVSLAIFGPQAPLQALGSFAIRYASYRQIYLGSAIVALTSAGWLAWAHTRQTSPATGRATEAVPQDPASGSIPAGDAVDDHLPDSEM